MARRMAINLNQRVSHASRGREDRNSRKPVPEPVPEPEPQPKIEPQMPTAEPIEDQHRGRKRSRSDPSPPAELLEGDLKSIMGFDSFQTTKNKHVIGIDCYAINLSQRIEYRQYMNRKGGFNRALSPTRGDKKVQESEKIKIQLKK